MWGNRISLFLSIALFAILSIGMANASLTITSNTITTPIDYPQNAIYTINGISGGVPPYTFNAYYTNGNVPANNAFLGSNTFSPGSYNAIIITITPNSLSPNSILITAYNGIVSTANILFSNTISTGTNTIYGTWTFNAFFADSTGANTISSSNTLTINTALATPTITPAATNTLDEGQLITIAAQVSGGTSPYTYNFIISQYGNPSNIIAYSGPVSNSLTSNSFVWVTNAIGTFVANVIVTDSANVPETANSVYSANIVVDPAPSITLTPSNTVLDSGQTETYTMQVSGGTGPFNVELYNITGSKSVGNVIISSPGGSNTISFTVNSLTSNTFTYNAIATDTGTTTPYVFSSTSNTITVNPALSVLISPTSNTLDANQVLSLATTVNGGTPSFTIGYTLSNTLCGSLSAASNTLSADGTNTIVFSPNTAITSQCSTTLTASVTDSASTHVTQQATSTLTVNPTPTATLLTPSNTILDSGQYVTYNVLISGGTLPITAKVVLVSNNIPIQINGANALPGTTYNTIVATSDGVITFNSLLITTSSSSGGAVTFNVIAFDSANTPVAFNAVANAITVNPAPYITLTATPSNSIMYGKPFTVNAVITGGTGNFAVYWYLNGNSITPTVVSTNAETSNTMTLPAAGNYLYIVSANDIGTSSVYILTPVTNTIVVAQNNTLTASSSGNPGSSYYSFPVTITFTGTPTINHQAKWSLYVNGQLYGTTNSTIKYYEQFAPPGTYNFVFNLTSDANYTPYTYKTSLVISYPPTGAYGVNTTVTTVTTTSTTTSIPTTSVTTTIPPSQKAISITANISSSSPLVLSLPNTRSTLSIYTTSTASTPIATNIANVTQQVSSFAKPKPNYTLISAVNLSIKTTAPITLFFVEHYPCSIPSDLVVPYIFKNNTWLSITNYTVNATACTVSFSIPSDPIVAIFEKSVPTTTTTSIATTIPTTIPTTIYYPSPSPKPRSPIVIEALVLIIIVIIIILVLLYYMLLHRRYHGFKR